MKDLIDWLQQMEHLAGSLYLRLGHKYHEDPEFSRFLIQLAKHEDSHLQLLRDADDHMIKEKNQISPDIILDQEMKDQFEIPLRDLYEQAISPAIITKKALLKAIVNIEFSEWNKIFIYVINMIQPDQNKYNDVREIIQEHKNVIEKFVNRHSEERDLVEIIRKLPNIGKHRLLIVEEKTPLRLFLGQMLEEMGFVEMAVNGQEALKKIQQGFFNAIVSNIDIPIMNGIDMFHKAIEKRHTIAERFLFYSRKITPEIEDLFRKHDLKYLSLPFGTNILHKVVRAILDNC